MLRADAVGIVLGMRLRPAVFVFVCTCACAGPSDDATHDNGNAPDTEVVDVAHDLKSSVDGGCAVDADCDDDNPCTIGARCVAGACTAAINVCTCAADADCATSDRCLARPFCNKAAVPWRCALDLAAAVTCDTSKDTVCAVTRCNAMSGTCQTSQAPVGTGCEDGAPCTTNDACKGGKCVGGSNDCGCSADADCAVAGDGPCDGAMICDKSTWPWGCAAAVGSKPDCSGGVEGQCATYGCDPKTGKCAALPKPAGTSCSDGDPCTSSDQCAAGVCAGTKGGCACSADVDCLGLDDGDLCNGVPTCEKAGNSGVCKLSAMPPVVCDSSSDQACVKSVCRPETGACVPTITDNLVQVCASGSGGKTTCTWQLAKIGAGVSKPVACDDGDACTTGELCSKGACAGGANLCGCKQDSDCASGDLCAGARFCDLSTGSCAVKPATIIQCPSANDTACLKNACAPQTGTCSVTLAAQATPVCDVPQATGAGCRWVRLNKTSASAAPCDDGDPCTTHDTCDGALCKSGPLSLGSAGCGCSKDSDCASDGDKCAGERFCNQATKRCATNPGSAVVCPVGEDNDCAKSACEPATGACKKVALEWSDPVCLPGQATTSCRRVIRSPEKGPAAAAFCDDGNACTKGDVCGAGACLPGEVTCVCQQDADCAPLDDGNLCNGTLRCDKSNPAKPACVPKDGSVVQCAQAPAGSCVEATCDPTSGKCLAAPLPDGVSCTDHDHCTTGDTCAAGACAGSVLACDDADACTSDNCDPTGGCVFLPKLCDDGNGCTVDSCNKKSGNCAFDTAAAHGLACDADNNPCTTNDSCLLGGCVVGAPLQCPSDGNPCTTAVCLPTKTGTTCAPIQRPNGASCDDDSSCTVGNTCKDGACSLGPKSRLYSGLLTKADVAGAAVAALPGRRMMVVSRRAQGTKWRSVATVLTETGAIQASWAVSNDHDNPLDGVKLAISEADGAMLVDRSELSGNSVIRTSKMTISADGKSLQKIQTLGLVGKWHDGKFAATIARDIERDGDGGLVVAGEVVMPGQSETATFPTGRPALWRLPAQGKTGLVQPWEGDSGHWPLGRNGALSPAKGGVFVLGTYRFRLVDKPRLLVSRLGASGPLWRRAIGRDAVGDLATIGVPSGDKGALAASRGGSNAVLTRLGPDGAVLWRRGMSAVETQALLPAAHDGVAALMYKTAGDPHLATSVLWRINAAGAVTSERPLLFGARVTGAALLDQRIALTGHYNLNFYESRALMASIDAFGNYTCALSGPCLGMAASACSDGKPCTADDCLYGKCTHKLTAQLQCTADDVCALRGHCQGDACVAGPGRLGTSVATETQVDSIQIAGAWRGSAGQPMLAYSFASGSVRWHRVLEVLPSGEAVARPHHAIGPISHADGDAGGHVAVISGSSQHELIALRPRISGQKADSVAICNDCDLDGLAHLRTAQDEGAYTLHRSASTITKLLVLRRFRITPKDGGTDYTLTWQLQLPPTDGLRWMDARLHRVPGAKPQAVIVAETRHVASTRRAAMVVVGDDGTKRWHHNGSPNETGAVIGAVASHGARLVHHVLDGLVARPWLSALAPSNGALLSKHELSGLAGFGVSAITPTDANGWVMAGIERIGGVERPWIAQVNAAGTLQWHRALQPVPKGSALFPGTPLLHGPGHLLLAAAPWFASNNTGRITITRADAFGLRTCEESGACAAKAGASCDDGNPCTADACTAKSGCVHQPVFGCGGSK